MAVSTKIVAPKDRNVLPEKFYVRIPAGYNPPLPRIAGESEDDFAKRVVEDSLTTRDGAADFGTAFHHGAERIAQTLEVDQADVLSA